MSTIPKRPGVTLVEILVVIGILGLLMGILLPAVQGIRGRASQMRCLDNVRQIGLGMHSYESAHGTLPPSQTKVDKNYINWMVTLLPYIEQDNLHRRTVEASRLDPNRFNDPPHIGLKTVIRTYICPADGRLTSPITDDQGYTAAYSSYMGMMGGIIKLPLTAGDQWGVICGLRGVRLTDITDGTSQTAAVGERTPPGRLFVGSWYNPGVLLPAWDFDGYERATSMGALKSYDEGRCRGPFPFGPGRIENPCDSNHFWSLHSGGANFLFADGSVRFLSYSAAAILPALATRAGGEVIEWPR